MINQRVAAVPMEPRGVLAQPDPLSGGLVVTTSTQNPHGVRQADRAARSAFRRRSIRVIAPEVGGGFGVKIRRLPGGHDLRGAGAAAAPPDQVDRVARRAPADDPPRARPSGRGLAGGAKQDGTITASSCAWWPTLAAYPRGAFVPDALRPADEWRLSLRNDRHGDHGVYTNTMATGAYRGAGRPEAAYYIERIMDVLAARTGHGPGRAAPQELHPARRLPAQDRDGHDLRQRRVREAAGEGAGDRRLRRAARRAGRGCAQQGRYIGIGVVTFTEICGFGPYESAIVRVEPSGAGDGRHRHLAARPGRRRRPSPRSSPTNSASRWTTWSSSTATPRAPRRAAARWARAAWSSAARRWWARSGRSRRRRVKIAAHKLEAAPERRRPSRRASSA